MLICPYFQVRIKGLFIRIGNSGKKRNLSATSFFVKALGVPLFANLQGGIYKNLNVVSHFFSKFLALLAIRRDKRGDYGHTVAGEQISHKTDPPDIFLSVFSAKSQFFG